MMYVAVYGLRMPPAVVKRLASVEEGIIDKRENSIHTKAGCMDSPTS